MNVFLKKNYPYEPWLLENEQQLCQYLVYYAQTRLQNHWNICPNIRKFGSHHSRHVWIVANYLSLFKKQVMLSWFLSSNYRLSSKISNFMFYDMGFTTSNLLPKRIVQSFKWGKKKIITIQFQFVKTCMYIQNVCFWARNMRHMKPMVHRE